jgi:hypothetical protein
MVVDAKMSITESHNRELCPEELGGHETLEGSKM